MKRSSYAPKKTNIDKLKLYLNKPKSKPTNVKEHAAQIVTLNDNE